MSRENVELVRNAYAAFRRRDTDRLLALVHPDAEFSSLIMEADARVYRGHAGLREYLRAVLEVLPDWEPTEETIEDFGDTLLVKARINASGAGSGARVEQVMWQVLTIRDGKAQSWRFFRSEAEAREAAARQA